MGFLPSLETLGSCLLQALVCCNPLSFPWVSRLVFATHAYVCLLRRCEGNEDQFFLSIYLLTVHIRIATRDRNNTPLCLGGRVKTALADRDCRTVIGTTWVAKAAGFISAELYGVYHSANIIRYRK